MKPITLSAKNATEEATYRWFENNVLVSTDPIFNVIAPGNYRVEVENGCKTVSDEVEILPNDFTNTLVPNLFACKGQVQTLNATVPGDSATYLWSNGSTDPMILVDSSGTFTVTISRFGCEVTQTIDVTFLDLSLNIDIGNDIVLCPKETLVLDAFTPNGRYEWQDGSTDSAFVVTEPGLYWVNVNNACATDSDTIRVTYKDFPDFELGADTTLCPDETLQLDVTQPIAATYLWSNGSTSPSIAVTQSDSIWVTVTADGCTVSDSIVVNFKPSINIDLGEDIAICTADTIELNAASDNPTAQYRWQDGSTDSVFVVTEPGLYVVEVFNECQNIIDSIQVTYQEFPRVDFGADKVLCPEESLLLDATNPESTYLWHDGSTNPTYNITSSTIAWVEVTHANGCVVRDTINIDYKPVLEPVSLGNDTTLCPQTSLILDATSTNPEAQYRWQDGSTDSIYVVTSPGLYAVEVFTSCRTFTDQIQVDYYDLPRVELGSDALLCPGESITLDATNPESTYLWHDGSTGPTFTATTTQQVWVAVTHNNGCTVRDTVQITFKPDPVVNFGPDGNLCEGEELVLNASNPYSTYLWHDGTTEPTFTVTRPGTYSVTVDNGCTTATDEITIDYIPLPFVDLGIDTLLCFGQSLLLTVEDQEGVTYRWQDGSDDLNFRVTETGKYWVELDRGGCIVSDTIDIFYVECLEDLIIPNIITPNGDGKNDYFVIDNLDLSLWILSIYDRNGNRILRSINYRNNWEAKGHPSDVYFYSLVRKGSDLKVNGQVTVIR